MAARKTPSAGGKPDKIMRDALSLELHQDAVIIEAGRKIRVKKYRLVARGMVHAAIKGDVQAGREIFDRMDGKVVQKIGGDAAAAPIKHEHSGEVVAKVKYDFTGLSEAEVRRLLEDKIRAVGGS